MLRKPKIVVCLVVAYDILALYSHRESTFSVKDGAISLFFRFAGILQTTALQDFLRAFLRI